MLYDTSVATFKQHLNALSAILDKAVAYCEARKIDPAALLSARLYPDMLPFVRQILIACDFAKNTGGRLAGDEYPKFADEEKTFPELKERIAKTLGYLATLDAAKINGAGGRMIEFPSGGHMRKMEAVAYTLHYALPNFYFHYATAYDILRHNGLEIGKRDYMGQVEGLISA